VRASSDGLRQEPRAGAFPTTLSPKRSTNVPRHRQDTASAHRMGQHYEQNTISADTFARLRNLRPASRRTEILFRDP
jgi:hypothetical protein